jgi:hypothetical protein
MGNSNALPYDIGDAVDYTNNNFWQLSVGSKKVTAVFLYSLLSISNLFLYQETKQPVSIFKFNKLQKHERIGLAQKNVQKTRTIR